MDFVDMGKSIMASFRRWLPSIKMETRCSGALYERFAKPSSG
jgi:hypothetical protein